MLITELMISEVADQLGIDQNLIRQQNMYKTHDITHFNTKIDDEWFVPEMWQNLLGDYNQIKQEVEEFNKVNKWKKRGIALIPSKYGVAFAVRHMNQATALVSLYHDGQVLLSHCGVEMGQGLHTKMIQIAANTLEIPMEKIFISESSTDKVINGSSTAASISSDLNGMAVLNACLKLKERLEPYRKAKPNGELKDWAMDAYLDSVCLSAQGFYKSDLSYDIKTNTGTRYPYFTNGVAFSVVELDVLTGDHTILRSDLIMDIGKSINYAVDVGQIEGAFIQGVGLYTIEEVLVQTSNGALLTRGPGNYKIPSSRDIPLEFNIKILKDKVYKNYKSIKSSKGIGEPPMFLAASVFFALRDAVKSARLSNNCKDVLFDFPSPCTSEVLRLACNDDISNKARVLPKAIKQVDKNGQIISKLEKSWSIRI